MYLKYFGEFLKQIKNYLNLSADDLEGTGQAPAERPRANT